MCTTEYPISDRGSSCAGENSLVIPLSPAHAIFDILFWSMWHVLYFQRCVLTAKDTVCALSVGVAARMARSVCSETAQASGNQLKSSGGSLLAAGSLGS